MAEYINREELLKDIEDSVRFSTRNGVSAELRGAHKIVDCIRSVPTADVVEVVHGEWIIMDDVLETIRECSCCHCKTYYPKPLSFNVRKSPYCEDCGAKMDGERRSENENT